MNSPINLLPESCLRQNLLRRRLRQWTPWWLLVLALGTLAGTVQFGRWQVTEFQVSSLQRAAEPVKKLQADLRNLAFPADWPGGFHGKADCVNQSQNERNYYTQLQET